jgi:hypothetical protein
VAVMLFDGGAVFGGLMVRVQAGGTALLLPLY